MAVAADPSPRKGNSLWQSHLWLLLEYTCIGVGGGSQTSLIPTSKSTVTVSGLFDRVHLIQISHKRQYDSISTVAEVGLSKQVLRLLWKILLKLHMKRQHDLEGQPKVMVTKTKASSVSPLLHCMGFKCNHRGNDCQHTIVNHHSKRRIEKLPEKRSPTEVGQIEGGEAKSVLHSWARLGAPGGLETRGERVHGRQHRLFLTSWFDDNDPIIILGLHAGRIWIPR